jgi:hypothetical protein
MILGSFEHVPIVQRPRTWPFQGQNTGSNPVGDARKGATPATPANNRQTAASPSKRYDLPSGVNLSGPASISRPLTSITFTVGAPEINARSPHVGPHGGNGRSPGASPCVVRRGALDAPAKWEDSLRGAGSPNATSHRPNRSTLPTLTRPSSGKRTEDLRVIYVQAHRSPPAARVHRVPSG